MAGPQGGTRRDGDAAMSPFAEPKAHPSLRPNDPMQRRFPRPIVSGWQVRSSVARQAS